MATDVLLVMEGGRLAAADPLSYESICRMKEGEVVTATIRRSRNPAHHRKLWALLNAVWENQRTFATTQDLLKSIKIATGLFETGKTVDGYPFITPLSISFAAMDQTRFEQWYEKAVEVVLTRIIPNINREDLERRILDILNGERNAVD